MAKLAIMAGALAGLLAVVCGAFGAHALKSRLSPESLSAFETAVSYQIYHALALLFTGLLLLHSPAIGGFHWAARLFIVGIVLFSGSLYVLALGGPRWFGPITPLGGLCFMAGWAMLLIGASGINSQ